MHRRHKRLRCIGFFARAGVVIASDAMAGPKRCDNGIEAPQLLGEDRWEKGSEAKKKSEHGDDLWALPI